MKISKPPRRNSPEEIEITVEIPAQCISFELEVDLIFYFTTTTSFSVEKVRVDLRGWNSPGRAMFVATQE